MLESSFVWYLSREAWWDDSASGMSREMVWGPNLGGGGTSEGSKESVSSAAEVKPREWCHEDMIRCISKREWSAEPSGQTELGTATALSWRCQRKEATAQRRFLGEKWYKVPTFLNPLSLQDEHPNALLAQNCGLSADSDCSLWSAEALLHCWF